MKMGSAFNLIIVSADSNKANHLARKSYELVEELESTFDPAENIDGEFTYRRGFLFKRKKWHWIFALYSIQAISQEG